MTKSILVFCIIFSFLSFNVRGEDIAQDVKTSASDMAQVDEQEGSEFDFELSDSDLDDIEEGLSLRQKISLLVQFLKLKGSITKDSVVTHVKNNKKVYASCALAGTIATIALLTKYYVGESQPAD